MKVILLTILCSGAGMTLAVAQTVVPPQTKGPGSTTIVVNPTLDECKKGWNDKLRWTRPQFDAFCNRLTKSK